MNLIKKIIKKFTTRDLRIKMYNILTSKGRKQVKNNNLQKKRIINEYKNSTDKEYKEIVEYLKTNKLAMYNYNFTKNYTKIKTDIIYDNEHEMYYVYHNNKKMYFSKAFDTKEKVESYYIFNCLEQDKESPHRYIFDKNKNYKCVLDLGVAEGNFALDIIDNAKEIYLFEADADWIEALEYTFAPYKDKVHIIKKYVSNKTIMQEVALDDFFGDNPQKRYIDMIKLDIEGAELMALKGASKIIEDNNVEINVCSYHYQEDESKIREYLNMFDITANGYLLLAFDKLKKPYLRRGVLHCTKKIKKEI